MLVPPAESRRSSRLAAFAVAYIAALVALAAMILAFRPLDEVLRQLVQATVKAVGVCLVPGMLAAALRPRRRVWQASIGVVGVLPAVMLAAIIAQALKPTTHVALRQDVYECDAPSGAFEEFAYPLDRLGDYRLVGTLAVIEQRPNERWVASGRVLLSSPDDQGMAGFEISNTQDMGPLHLLETWRLGQDRRLVTIRDEQVAIDERIPFELEWSLDSRRIEMRVGGKRVAWWKDIGFMPRELLLNCSTARVFFEDVILTRSSR